MPLRNLSELETSTDDDNLEYLVTILLQTTSHITLIIGEFVYYKNILPFKLINIKYNQARISFERRIGEKCCKFICLYRSLSQTNDEFESFLKYFEVNLDKIHEENQFMISALDDFSANWCKNDTSSQEGSMLDAVTSNYGLHQLTQEPKHILNSSFSFIDLIFTSQSNLVMESGARVFIFTWKLPTSGSLCKS